MIKGFILFIAASFVLLSGFDSKASAAQNTIIEGLNRGIEIATGTDGSATSTPSVMPSPVGSRNVYAALGDSIAAGLGLGSVPNATIQDMRCGRSSQSYPHIVAQQTNLRLLLVACSGATAGDLFTSQGISGPNPGPQLDKAFSQGKPQLITITAGANDVHWSSFARVCYVNNCATDFNAGVARLYLAGLHAKLTFAFSGIQNRSNGSPPTVVVTGYYNPVSNFCKNRQNYASNAEIDFLNNLRDDLNQTIRDAAAPFPFVKYASVNFSGHGLCSNDPWAQGINDAAPLHPNVNGQEHIAESVLDTINR